jgi:hypothetical protein
MQIVDSAQLGDRPGFGEKHVSGRVAPEDRIRLQPSPERTIPSPRKESLGHVERCRLTWRSEKGADRSFARASSTICAIKLKQRYCVANALNESVHLSSTDSECLNAAGVTTFGVVVGQPHHPALPRWCDRRRQRLGVSRIGDR